jgi:hypothetical protein
VLEHSEALMTLAEVSATFAGFAALVTLFARRRVEGGTVHDLMRLRIVIGTSVAAVMAALFPVAAAGLGLPEGMIWQASVLLFMVLLYFVIGSFVSSYKSVRGTFPPDKLAVMVALGLEILIQISLITILVGGAGERQFGLYIAAIIGTIGQAGFVFLRLVESSFSTIAYRSDKVTSTT